MIASSPTYLFERALQEHRQGRLTEAESLFRRILAQDPQHPIALHHLGIIAHQTGRNEIAAELMTRVIGLRPDYVEAIYNLGIVLRELGRFDDAIAANRRTISLRPGYADAHVNLGNALRDLGRVNEALAAYRQAIALNPAFPEAHNNLGVALRELGEPEKALAACRRAIAHRPEYADAYINLSNALKDVGRLEEATAACRKAVALNPNSSEAHSSLIYALHFHRDYDALAIAEEHRRWNLQHAAPLLACPQGFDSTAVGPGAEIRSGFVGTTDSGRLPERSPRRSVPAFSRDRSPDRRLRIGYVSPDFRDHVVGRNLLPLLREHDHGQFEIFCYAQASCGDAMTPEFQKHADRWRNIVGLSDGRAAEQIRNDRIDVLVDLTLHMADNRLLVFARKPAPVQVTFAGYPGSTGLGAMDYRLSDPHLDPPGMDESIYSEKTIRLADSFWCYDPLDARDIPVNSLPALETGVVTFGCLNNFCKINDPTLSNWAKAIRQVEKSRLILSAPEGSHRRKTLDLLGKEGIDPSRVTFVPPLPREKYLEQYHRIDIGLDSFPYNGHTTSLDSFWMGVPVVTLVGTSPVSRAGWCQASNLGLRELAGQTPEQFVEIVVELAKNLPRLKELRKTLRERMEESSLMNGPRFARTVEAAYREMWRKWCETVPGMN